MHLEEVVVRDLVVQAIARPPIGPGFTTEDALNAERMEIWGSDFTEEGPDYCLFKLFGEKNVVLATQRVEGY